MEDQKYGWVVFSDKEYIDVYKNEENVRHAMWVCETKEEAEELVSTLMVIAEDYNKAMYHMRAMDKRLDAPKVYYYFIQLPVYTANKK